MCDIHRIVLGMLTTALPLGISVAPNLSWFRRLSSPLSSLQGMGQIFGF